MTAPKPTNWLDSQTTCKTSKTTYRSTLVSATPNLGALAPIRVVNVVFTAGDANSGVQTAAFNLPNDERVVEDYGSKRVMLKNVQEAKFNGVLLPISQIALPAFEREDIAFDAFFTHILMHELMHGLGPHSLTINDVETTVRQELRETYSTLEEAKADISGLWALHYLIDQGVVDRSMARSIYSTFLASAFRSIRFGINEAHGRGVAIQLNTFLDEGGVTVGPDGRFSVDHSLIRGGRGRTHASAAHHPGKRRLRGCTAGIGDVGRRTTRGSTCSGPARGYPDRYPTELRHGCRAGSAVANVGGRSAEHSSPLVVLVRFLMVPPSSLNIYIDSHLWLLDVPFGFA